MGALAESLGMKTPSGALVSKILDDSPASKAGLKTGDVILEFEGKTINRSSDLPPLVGHAPIGSTAKLKVLRRGKTQILQVKVAELPSEEKLDRGEHLGEEGQVRSARPDRGGSAAEQRKALQLDRYGVLVQEIEDGAAANSGIRRGDVILKINGTDIENPAHLRKLVQALPPGKSLRVLLQRRSGPVFLAVKIPDAK